MTARSRVIPWDLWMVIPQAHLRGTWLTAASTVSPSMVSQAAGFIVTSFPFWKDTIGQPPLAWLVNPFTVPIEPLTY